MTLASCPNAVILGPPDAPARRRLRFRIPARVKLWDSHTGELRRSLRGHTGLVSSLAFAPDGTWLVSGSRDHTAKVWDLTSLDHSASR